MGEKRKTGEDSAGSSGRTTSAPPRAQASGPAAGAPAAGQPPAQHRHAVPHRAELDDPAAKADGEAFSQRQPAVQGRRRWGLCRQDAN
eukprot:3507416-Pyramimonas_sp.AAC.1